ncbi:MAG: DUF6434 domain-containing protein [Cyanobacteria bacterium J06631_9]
MERPKLIEIKKAKDFDQWYWLKAELVTFCRAQGLRISGNKADIAHRIRHFLDTGEKEPPQKQPRKKVTSQFDWHSAPLTLETKITDSYKNTQNVRRFMVSQVGKSFRFSIPLMKWMKENEGKTLAAAILQWETIEKSKRAGNYTTEIPPGNEYNQYVRDFSQDNPGQSLSAARRCWAYKRSQPGRNRYHPDDLINSGMSPTDKPSPQTSD